MPIARGTHNLALRIDCFHLPNRVGNGNGADAFLLQANHLSKTAAGDQVHRAHAEARSEDSIVGRFVILSHRRLG